MAHSVCRTFLLWVWPVERLAFILHLWGSNMSNHFKMSMLEYRSGKINGMCQMATAALELSKTNSTTQNLSKSTNRMNWKYSHLEILINHNVTTQQVKVAQFTSQPGFACNEALCDDLLHSFLQENKIAPLLGSRRRCLKTQPVITHPFQKMLSYKQSLLSSTFPSL